MMRCLSASRPGTRKTWTAVTVQPGAVVSKVIHRDEDLDVTVFAFDVGEGLTEAELVTWHVAVGDTVKVNDIVVEVALTDAVSVVARSRLRATWTRCAEHRCTHRRPRRG